MVNGKRLVFLDIETNTKHDQIWCCVTKADGEVKVWTEARKLNEYLKPSDLIVMHNGILFDAPILNRQWNTKIRLSQCKDTLIMSRLLNPNRENGHSLAAFGLKLGFQKIDFNDYDGGLSDEMVEYCIRDVELLEKVYYELENEKRVLGFSEQSVELEHEVAAIITKQERRGFKLDVPRSMEFVASLRDKAGQLEQRLQEVFQPITHTRVSEKTGKPLKDRIEVFNPSSRQQISKRLQEKGWKPEKFTEKGQAIVDESVLANVPIAEAQLIAEYLLLHKRVAQVESWLEAVGEDGRVHGKVITNGAVTGRATHSSPNLAQVPNTGSQYGKECRELWIAEEGYTLVGVDLAQLELRCLAHYMKDDDYTKELLSGDIHTKNQQAAGLATRSQAKQFIFALCYGAGPEKIGLIAGVSKQEGQHLINRFLANTPALKNLREKVERMSAKGTIPGLDGRILHVRSAHAALNTLLQSAGAIVSKQWMVEIKRQCQQENIEYHQVAWVHDELQSEVRHEHAERFAVIAVEAARRVTDVFKMRCPMDAEAKLGYNWYQCH